MKLDSWLKKEHSLPERLRVVAGLCSALDDAHRRGVVHGGLEPAGVEIGNDGSCRLDSGPPRPSSPYAAPERAQPGSPTAKAEIYSAGVICYEVLAGQPPFASDPPRPLQEMRPDLPSDITDAVTACLERDPEWRPADLTYLLALTQSLRNEEKASASAPSAPRPAPARRVAPPPRTILEASPRRRGDDRSALTRALPVLLVVVAIAGTGGAWLWFEVLRPSRAGGGPSAAGPSSPPPTSATSEQPARAPIASASEPAPPAATTPAAGPPPSLPATPRATPLVPPPDATVAPQAAVPPRPSALAPPATTLAAVVPAAPTPAAVSDTSGPANPPPNPEPTPDLGDQPAARAEDQAVVGPASIRAIAPFRLRPGSLHVLDVHGSGLRADHRARIVPHKRREPESGFAVTRYQLRNPGLLLVFLQVDASVRPGKYAFSLADAGGSETNAFTIEVVGK